RKKLQGQNGRIGAFLHAYVEKMFQDPETRELNKSPAFRDVHARIVAARTLEELMREVDSARQSPAFTHQQRRLLCNGRSSDCHTREMREMRQAGWMTVDQRVKALSEGWLPMSAPLKKLLDQFDSCGSQGELDYFVQAVKVPPEKLRKPAESIERGIWKLR